MCTIYRCIHGDIGRKTCGIITCQKRSIGQSMPLQWIYTSGRVSRLCSPPARGKKKDRIRGFWDILVCSHFVDGASDGSDSTQPPGDTSTGLEPWQHLVVCRLSFEGRDASPALSSPTFRVARNYCKIYQFLGEVNLAADQLSLSLSVFLCYKGEIRRAWQFSHRPQGRNFCLKSGSNPFVFHSEEAWS